MIHYRSTLTSYLLDKVVVQQLEEGPVFLYGYGIDGSPLVQGYAYARNPEGGPKDEYWITPKDEKLPYPDDHKIDFRDEPKLDDEAAILEWLRSKLPNGLIRKFRLTETVLWPNIPSFDYRIFDKNDKFMGLFTARVDGGRYSEAVSLRNDAPKLRFPFNIDLKAELIQPSVFGGPGSPKRRMDLAMTLLGHPFPDYKELTSTLIQYWDPESLTESGSEGTRSIQSVSTGSAAHLITDGSGITELEEGPVFLRNSRESKDYFGVGHKPSDIGEEWWEVPHGTKLPFDKSVYLDLSHDRTLTKQLAHSAVYCRKQSQSLCNLRPVHAKFDRTMPLEKWPKKKAGESETFAIKIGEHTVGIYSHRKATEPPNDPLTGIFYEAMIVIDESDRKAPLNFSCFLEHFDSDPMTDAGTVYDQLTAVLESINGPLPAGKKLSKFFSRVEICSY